MSPKPKDAKSKKTKEKSVKKESKKEIPKEKAKEEIKQEPVKKPSDDSINEPEPEIEEKKSETHILLDSLDEERVEGYKQTSEKLEGIIKKKEKKEKDKTKEKTDVIVEGEEKELTVGEIKRMMDLLNARKQECYDTEMYEEAIAIANDVINLAKKAKMNIRIEQEKTSISKMRDLIEDRANEKIIIEKIEGLKAIKHNFYIKEDYEEAINTSYKIINYANKLDMKSLVKKEGKSIEAMNKKLAKAPLKTDPAKQIEGLKAVKHDHLVKFNFTQAIKVTEKIIDLATRGGLKSVVKEEKKDLEEIKKKVRKEPSKMEIIEQIEGLKGVKQGHAVKGDYDNAIKVSHKIIDYAKIANLTSIIQEEEKSIKDMEEKLEREAYFSTIKEEYKKIDESFDEHVDEEEIVKAHDLIEDFKKKYSDLSFFKSIPGVKDLIEKDRKVWLRYKVKQDYIKGEKEKEQLPTKVVKPKPSKEKPKPKKEEKIKEAVVEEVKKEVPAIPEKEIQRFELENAKLEEEKARLRLERLRFEKERERFEIENKKVELDKVELEENLSRLKLGKVRLKKDKEKFELKKQEFELANKILEEENSKLEESQLEFERDDKALGMEISEFQKEKERFEEARAKLEEEKAAMEEERTKFEEMTIEYDEMREQLEDLKAKLKEIGTKESSVSEAVVSEEIELELAALDEEKANLKLEYAKIKKEKLQLKLDKKNFLKEKVKFEEEKMNQ